MTNAAEIVHAIAWKEAGQPSSPAFIEHYPAEYELRRSGKAVRVRRKEIESFDEVRFDVVNGMPVLSEAHVLSTTVVVDETGRAIKNELVSDALTFKSPKWRHMTRETMAFLLGQPLGEIVAPSGEPEVL